MLRRAKDWIDKQKKLAKGKFVIRGRSRRIKVDYGFMQGIVEGKIQ